jgi:hypothetical protein
MFFKIINNSQQQSCLWLAIPIPQNINDCKCIPQEYQTDKWANEGDEKQGKLVGIRSNNLNQRKFAIDTGRQTDNCDEKPNPTQPNY